MSLILGTYYDNLYFVFKLLIYFNTILVALQQNERNIGKHFLLEFKVDKNIKGGLILYTENEFMDMSLSSRINKINQELKVIQFKTLLNILKYLCTTIKRK